MTTPVPAPQIFPNIEAVLVPWITASLQSVFGVTVRVLTETPVNLEDVVPVVQVSSQGGLDVLGILARPLVDIDCFAGSREAAETLAAQVNILLLKYVTGTVSQGAVIGLVNTVKAPGWLSYQDPDVRRYNATYEIYTHPAPQ